MSTHLRYVRPPTAFPPTFGISAHLRHVRPPLACPPIYGISVHLRHDRPDWLLCCVSVDEDIGIFSWDEYLKTTGAVPAPKELFKMVTINVDVDQIQSYASLAQTSLVFCNFFKLTISLSCGTKTNTQFDILFCCEVFIHHKNCNVRPSQTT